jgi:hypothetical protein
MIVAGGQPGGNADVAVWAAVIDKTGLTGNYDFVLEHKGDGIRTGLTTIWTPRSLKTVPELVCIPSARSHAAWAFIVPDPQFDM